jgi:O-antigen ligase
MQVLSKFNAQTMGNFFLFCLFGSIFVQTRPSAVVSLLGLCLGIIFYFSQIRKAGFDGRLFKQSYFIWGTLLLWPAAHLMIALAHAPFTWTNLGNPFRAILAIGVFAFLAYFHTTLKCLYAGIGLACIATFSHAGYDRFILKLPRSIGWFNNEIHYGDYSSLVGILAIVIAFLAHQLSYIWRCIFFFLGCLACIAAAASGTRTALLSLVCIIPLFIMQNIDTLHRRLRFILVIGVSCVAITFAISGRIRDETRITEAISDVNNMMEGRSQSSIGDRKQMWIAALDMARTSPVLGIGLNNFGIELERRIASKKILPLLEKQNQAHSQILHSLATGGLVLLLTYLLFVCAPFIWFFQLYRKHSTPSKTRLLTYLGMTTIFCHLLFGLTAAIFDIQVFSSLYLFSLATFAGLCMAQKQHASMPGNKYLK